MMVHVSVGLLGEVLGHGSADGLLLLLHIVQTPPTSTTATAPLQGTGVEGVPVPVPVSVPVPVFRAPGGDGLGVHADAALHRGRGNLTQTYRETLVRCVCMYVCMYVVVIHRYVCGFVCMYVCVGVIKHAVDECGSIILYLY